MTFTYNSVLRFHYLKIPRAVLKFTVKLYKGEFGKQTNRVQQIKKAEWLRVRHGFKNLNMFDAFCHACTIVLQFISRTYLFITAFFQGPKHII